MRVNNRPSDVIAPRDTSVAFKWLLSRLCLDADVDLWNSIKLHGIPYRPNRVVASQSKHPPDPHAFPLPLPDCSFVPPVATAIFFAVPKERARAFAVTFFPPRGDGDRVGKEPRERRSERGRERRKVVLPFYLRPFLPNWRFLCRATGHSEGRKFDRHSTSGATSFGLSALLPTNDKFGCIDETRQNAY